MQQWSRVLEGLIPPHAENIMTPFERKGIRKGVYVVTNRQLTGGRPLLEVVEAAVFAGAVAVQVREKDLSGRDLFSLVRGALRITRRAGAVLVVNDRLDVALAAGADGVHLSQASLSVEAARRVGGPGLIIGASVHSLEEAEEACGADYLIFGNVFATGSKPGLPGRGIQALAAVCRRSSAPVFAIGGVTSGNIAAVCRAGAAGAAVMSGVMAASDPAAAVSEMVRAWGEADAWATKEG